MSFTLSIIKFFHLILIIINFINILFQVNFPQISLSISKFIRNIYRGHQMSHHFLQCSPPSVFKHTGAIASYHHHFYVISYIIIIVINIHMIHQHHIISAILCTGRMILCDVYATFKQ